MHQGRRAVKVRQEGFELPQGLDGRLTTRLVIVLRSGGVQWAAEVAGEEVQGVVGQGVRGQVHSREVRE